MNDIIYVDAKISREASYSIEIHRRVGMVKTAMANVHKMWKDISKDTKARVVRTY